MGEVLKMRKFLIVLMFIILLCTVACAENVIRVPYDLIVKDTILSGHYTGEMENNRPEGFGVFEAISPSGIPCHYIGEWENGLMNGNGSIHWDDGSIEIGEYRNGVFVSGQYNYNGLQLIKASSDGEKTLNPFMLTQTKASLNSSDEPVVAYIGNKSSHVFHTLDCDSVRTMKEKNKVELFSREEAVEKKYKPCKRCDP